MPWIYAALIKNEPTAAECYCKAAEQGHADAQFYHGVMYNLGCGVDKNEVTEVEWYRKAADQGHAIAQERLDRLTKQSSYLDNVLNKLKNGCRG